MSTLQYRNIRRKLGLVLVGLMVATSPLAARASSIGLYTDEGGASCSFSGNEPGLVTAYVVVRPGPEGVRAVRFSAPVPSCFGGVFVEDESPAALPFIGESQTGISIASGNCEQRPLHVLTIRYMRTGSTATCCAYPIVPEQGFSIIQAVNCAGEETSYSGNTGYFNADASCACDDPPLAASDPSPRNGETGLIVTTPLSWSSDDYDGDLVDFDVYLGTSPTPPLVAAHVDVTTYQPGSALAPVAHYYWRVVARDAHGNETSSPTWEFWTRLVNTPPLAPRPLNPTVGETVTLRSLRFQWESGDIDQDPLRYDVHFGTVNPPPLVSERQTETYRNSGALLRSTTYYWRIVVHDLAGNTTTGDVWHFTTSNWAGPDTPSTPSPASGQTGVSVSTSFSWQGNGATYDVYLGHLDEMQRKVVSSSTSASFTLPQDLLPNRLYNWYVVAYSDGVSIRGPAWYFWTGSAMFSQFVATQEDAGIRVDWTVQDAGIESYALYRRHGSSQPTLVVDGALTAPTGSYLDQDIQTGANYGYEMLLFGNDGEEFRSRIARVAPGAQLELGPNHPNPFNPQTTIPYNLPTGGHVRIAVYDPSGRLVRTLVDGQQTPGTREVVWDGTDDAGRGTSSGVYFCFLRIGEESRTRKLVLLK